MSFIWSHVLFFKLASLNMQQIQYLVYSYFLTSRFMGTWAWAQFPVRDKSGMGNKNISFYFRSNITLSCSNKETTQPVSQATTSSLAWPKRGVCDQISWALQTKQTKKHQFKIIVYFFPILYLDSIFYFSFGVILKFTKLHQQ